MAVNLDDVFRATALRQPRHPAILGPGPSDSLSYAGLDEAIAAASAQLRRAGVRPGDCVGLHHPSGAGYVVWNYALWRCGACVVPVPVELAPAEKQEVLRTIALTSVLSSTNAPFVEPFRRGGPASLPGATLVSVASPGEEPPGLGAINPAFIRFTSGTTGSAKGVVLSHETIHARIHAANEVLHVGPDDRVVWLLSMAYHFAVSVVAYLRFGATILLPANHFAPAVLSASTRHRATLMYGSPAHYAWLAGAEQAPALPDLRLALSTTAPLDRPTAVRFHRCYGLPVTQALGIIEIGLPFINVDFASEKPEGVGRVLPAYRLRMEDVGLGPDRREVLLAGPGFLDAYYQPWRARAEVMPDGWFHTGDVGELDADGCLTLRGRAKDVINVLGMKVFPQEVESALASHPAVEGACVFAAPDERLGEVPHAYVLPRAAPAPGLEAELLAHCTARLAAYKVPQRIELVTSLPRTPSGKLLHRPATPARGVTTEPLNAADRALLLVDRTLRTMGCPGFETQMFVWLSGPADADSLRAALARLARRHPLVTARLAEVRGAPRWRLRPDAPCPLEEVRLPSAGRQAVLDHAAGRLSAPAPLEERDPVRFTLLRRPAGGDVLLVQYNHTLLDNNAAGLLLRELGRLSRAEAGPAASAEAGDLVWHYLRRFPPARRREVTAATVARWRQALRGGAVMLGRTPPGPAAPVRLRIAARRLGEEGAKALHDRVVRTCGFPALSMALLGSAFRAVARLAPRGTGREKFIAGLGIDLGVRARGGPLFHNLTSLVPVLVRAGDLADRDDLTRSLSRQLRERLASGEDLGVLRLAVRFGRQASDAAWAIELFLRHAFSLWYAYFGAPDVGDEDLGGCRVEDVFFAGPSWPPVGLTLLVNSFRGRLWFGATHVPEVVPESLAEEFLEEVLRDLAE
jgi:long-chain acyl-CoA synthetase